MSQQHVDALSVDQLWDAVCLSTRECPHWSHQSKSVFDAKNIADQEAHLAECPDPGRVWALPGMQERCPCLTHSRDGVIDDLRNCGYAGPCELAGKHVSGCLICHGSGYVAKRDLGALLDCLYDVRFLSRHCNIRIRADSGWASAEGVTKTAALLRAVAKALLAQGAELA